MNARITESASAWPVDAANVMPPRDPNDDDDEDEDGPMAEAAADGRRGSFQG
jgi:hypothetical protein